MGDHESEGRSRIPVMLAVILILLVVSVAYSYRQLPRRTQEQAKVSDAKPAQSASPVAPQISPTAQRLTEAVSMMPTRDGVVINIELPKAIRYEGYQLDHPDRIYFDLHDVKLSDDKGSEFKQADGLVSGVRLFTYGNGVTRVVFDLRHPASFGARLEENPARLTIELKRIGESNDISEADPRTKLGLHIGPNSP